MKIIFSVLTVLLSLNLSYAESIQGPDAEKLFKAMIKAEVKVEGTYNRFLKISRVRCDYTPQGFIYAHCDYIDEHQNRERKHSITEKAMDLFSALKEVGIPADQLNVGISRERVAVSELSCEHVDAIAGAFFYFCNYEL